jgi:hypothetical protein
MTPEDVARRFERRPGYDLIDYAEVALPLYRLNIDSVTMVHRDIAPIKEFVMRSIAARLQNSDAITGFLGLDIATVEATIDQLLEEKYATNHDNSVFELTERGVEILAKAKESSPQDEMLVFLYDRLLLKPVRLAPEQLMTPAQIDSQRTIEIRPYPAEGPNINDIPLPEVLQVLQAQVGGHAAFGRDLLRLKRIVRRIRFYRPGVALVYKKIHSSEIQIAFIVDEARQETLEHAFAERGGPKKMGFIKSIDESSTNAELRRYLGADVLNLVPDSSEFDEKRLAVSIARLKHQAALGRAERSGNQKTPDMAETIEAAAGSLGQAEKQLQSFPARPVSPYELPELLNQALENCERRLVISSRTVDRSIVDSTFLKRLEHVLQRGVRVLIRLNEVEPKTPAIELEQLRNRYSQLELHSNKRGQFHHLICDTRFAVISNRPFLSNLKKVRTFYHVVGYLLQREDLVAAFASRVDDLNKPDNGAVHIGGIKKA